MIETLWNKHFSYSLKENQAYMTKTSFASALMEYHNSNPLDAEVVAKLADIKKEYEEKFFTEMEYPNNEKIPVLFTAKRRAELWVWILSKFSE